MTTLMRRLGPVVKSQLEELRNQGWSLHRWAPGVDKAAEIIGAARTWDDGAADVVVIRSHLMAAGFRAMPCNDAFNPLLVTLYDMAPPPRLLAGVLRWDAYGEEYEQREPLRPPPGLVLPAAVRRRYTQMIDLPNNPETVVVPPPPFYNTATT